MIFSTNIFQVGVKKAGFRTIHKSTKNFFNEILYRHFSDGAHCDYIGIEWVTAKQKKLVVCVGTYILKCVAIFFFFLEFHFKCSIHGAIGKLSLFYISNFTHAHCMLFILSTKQYMRVIWAPSVTKTAP